MFKRLISFLLVFLISLSVFSIGYCQEGNKNLSRKEAEKLIEEIARKRGIPSVILKSIAKMESSFQQFNKDGTTYASRGGNVGIMQVQGRNSGLDLEKLKKDPQYNIEAGADVLLAKWRLANEKLPSIGNMDPNILEHWYFVLWAYNGLLERNNPNFTTRSTYQDKIYKVANKEYGQKISTIDKKLLPSRGVPRNTLKLKTPKTFHEGDILKYGVGNVVKADGKKFLLLLEAPYGKEIGRIDQNTTLTIIEGSTLKKGFYFYKVKNEDGSKTGWVFGNWLKKVE